MKIFDIEFDGYNDQRCVYLKTDWWYDKLPYTDILYSKEFDCMLSDETTIITFAVDENSTDDYPIWSAKTPNAWYTFTYRLKHVVDDTAVALANSNAPYKIKIKWEFKVTFEAGNDDGTGIKVERYVMLSEEEAKTFINLGINKGKFK
jgi:hypothetical protein